MRIALVSQYYPPEPVGIPAAIAQHLTGLGHRVLVVTATPNYPTGEAYAGYSETSLVHEYGESGETIVRLPTYAYHGPSPFRRVFNYGSFAVASLIWARKLLGVADAIYVYGSPVTAGLVPALMRRFDSGPGFVIHAQDLWPESVLETGLANRRYVRPIIGKGAAWLARIVYSSASRIVAISPGARCQLASRPYVKPGQVRTVFNWADERRVGVDLQTVDPRRASSLHVMYAGNVGHAQGLDSLIEAVGILDRDGKDVRLTIVGTGSDLGRIMELSEALSTGTVSFIPPQPPERMASLYAQAHLHVVSLRCSPLFGHTVPGKLQQLLSHGLPILCIAEGDAARIVEDARAGWTAPPGRPDAIANTLREAAACSDLGPYGERGQLYYRLHMRMAIGLGQLATELEAVSAASSDGRGGWGSSKIRDWRFGRS